MHRALSGNLMWKASQSLPVPDSSNEALMEAALNQAMHTRWSPALVDGVASPYITIYKPVFKLY